MYSELYLYGLKRGYWSNIIEYGDRSQEDKDLVLDVMFEENNGASGQEYSDLKVSELQEWRVKYVTLR